MKKRSLLLATPFILASSLSSCGNTGTDTSTIVFSSSDLIQSSFGGLGVEWGIYEDTDMLDKDSYIRIEENIEHLAPSRIRLMFNYDYFVSNFEDGGDKDKTNDTWTYNFANKWGDSLFYVLSYCQKKGIEVALGAWNVIGTLTNDVWGMMDECTSDYRWAKISGDILDYLVNKQGFTCIRWFVNSNEPNYLGSVGSSKNYNNTFEKWMQGVKNVRAVLDSKGLTNIGIVGGDTTGFDGTNSYWEGIAKNIPTLVSDYGAHFYLSNYYIDGGYALEYMNTLNSAISSLDKGYGTTRPLNIWETGLLDGKDASSDSNSLIKTVGYGVRMADLTIQACLAGFNGLAYWSFDDAQNFMYSGSVATPKKWGMFSSLSSASASDQERRPWYHSSCLLTHLLSKQSKIYGSAVNSRSVDPTFRCLGVAGTDKKSGGYAAVNRGTKEITKKFALKDKVDGSGKLYVYIFGEGQIKLNEQGFISPNYSLDGSLNKLLSVSIPANSLMIVSSEVL